jgi:hypothetical protein
MTVYKMADMAKWSQKAKDNAAFVVIQSIDDVSRIAQTPKAKGGRMPVDKSFLRNSYRAGLNGSTGLKGPDVYVAALAGMEMGDTFTARWTADYALRMERGFSGPDSLGRVYSQQGNFFMRSALAQWQAINDANAAKVAAL